MKRTLHAILITLAIVFLTRPAAAGQHLVMPGTEWSAIDGRVKPGDEIILFPGEHRTARFLNLQGTHDKPITIRSADPRRPATIADGRHGIRLDNPKHVRIRNLRIRDCSMNGITIYDPVALGLSHTADIDIRDVIIENVHIERIGPKKRRNGIQAFSVFGLSITKCSFDGWGGAGIELVGCREVAVTKCRFTGDDAFLQTHGLIARGGTNRLSISDCRFECAGPTAFRFGGTTSMSRFRPPVTDDTVHRTTFEADGILVRRCLVVDSPTLFHVSHVGQMRVGNVTAVGLGAPMLLATIDYDDPRMMPVNDLRFVACMFVWNEPMSSNITQLAGGIDPEKLVWESGLWWSPDDLETRAALVEQIPGRKSFPPVTDVNPELDDAFEATIVQAGIFGTRSP